MILLSGFDADRLQLRQPAFGRLIVSTPFSKSALALSVCTSLGSSTKPIKDNSQFTLSLPNTILSGEIVKVDYENEFVQVRNATFQEWLISTGLHHR